MAKHNGWALERRTYQCWQDMKQRCFNEKSGQFKNYGARGITVCARWAESFAAFFADMGAKPNGMTLDRIDNNGDYCPENCRWASLREQNNNKRTCNKIEYNGEVLTVSQWSARIGIHRDSLTHRIAAGWSIEHALTRPKKPGHKYAAREGQ